MIIPSSPGFLRLSVAGLTIVSACALRAEIAVTANDNKLVLVDGVSTVVKNPPPDTVSIVDLAASPIKVVGEVSGVPSSVIGPPLSVAIAPDESLALITAAMQIDPKDPTKQTEDHRMSVIDLKASPAKVIATLETGKGPAGVSINHQGTLALVANRGDGTISIYSIQDHQVTPAGKLQLGTAASEIDHVVFLPDGKRALATRGGDHLVSILAIDGTKVTPTGRDVRPGLHPYGIDVTPDGAVAVVANDGFGSGDADTISVIDLKADPARVVDTLTVGQTPEGIKVSPDGKLCAVLIENGSNKPKSSPFFNDHAALVVFRVDGTKLTRIGEGAIGHWSQGIAFSRDSHTILVTNMVEKDLQVFRCDGIKLGDTGERIKVSGGPAAIRTAE